MAPALTLLYRRRAPSHYVARLGEGGWCEGWGWTADEALAHLARVITDIRPAGVPSHVLPSAHEVFGWLERDTPIARLDDG